MDIGKIEQELQPELAKWFQYEICYIDNLDEPVLLILDYSSQNNAPPASFALSLADYEEGKFPSKCWITHNKVRPVGNQPNLPKLHDAYKEFSSCGHKFHPFSVQLHDYNPQKADSIKQLIDSLYCHINFELS